MPESEVDFAFSANAECTKRLIKTKPRSGGELRFDPDRDAAHRENPSQSVVGVRSTG